MLKKMVYSLGNLTGIALFTFLCTATLQSYQKTGSLFAFTIVLINGLILAIYFVRREPRTLIEFPFAWLISMVTTVLPFLYRPIQEAFFTGILKPWLLSTDCWRSDHRWLAAIHQRKPRHRAGQ